MSVITCSLTSTQCSASVWVCVAEQQCGGKQESTEERQEKEKRESWEALHKEKKITDILASNGYGWCGPLVNSLFSQTGGAYSMHVNNLNQWSGFTSFCLAEVSVVLQLSASWRWTEVQSKLCIKRMWSAEAWMKRGEAWSERFPIFPTDFTLLDLL